MLPTSEKIVEYAVKEQLEYFPETNDIHIERQSGYRSVRNNTEFSIGRMVEINRT